MQVPGMTYQASRLPLPAQQTFSYQIYFIFLFEIMELNIKFCYKKSY